MKANGIGTQVLPSDQLHAGNVQNMLYISCCFTVSSFVTCPYSHHPSTPSSSSSSSSSS
ncbi:conserved hypothetical protein [Ricinus communis]|uniref:Uncharacterized protein n=1 Tax=Ricinus communis TaxID=3988 RepID=B9SJE2_RICCO|nr:conserved hypothetical protein [Ricinus communis]